MSRGITLLFLRFRHSRRGVGGQPHAPAASTSRERPGTHCTGGWVGPRAGLDGWKISSAPRFFFFYQYLFIVTYQFDVHTKHKQNTMPFLLQTYQSGSHESQNSTRLEHTVFSWDRTSDLPIYSTAP